MLKKLSNLNPKDFENLAYDLLFAMELRNLIWRSPGADGGRDLEGDFSSRDFSGDTMSQKWYVECKRYSKSIDWPTVRSKTYYAINNNADFLLFFTNSRFSPQCINEVLIFNRQNYLKIRIWDGAKIVMLLHEYKFVAIKYGLLDADANTLSHFENLFSQVVELSYCAEASRGLDEIEQRASACLFSLVELLAKRKTDIENFGRFAAVPFRTEDIFDWIMIDNPTVLTGYDRFGLRALLAALRHVLARDQIALIASRTELAVEAISSEAANAIQKAPLLAAVAPFSLLRYRVDGNQICLEPIND